MEDGFKTVAFDTLRGDVAELPTTQMQIRTYGPLLNGVRLLPIATPLTPETVGYYDEVLILTADLFRRHPWPADLLRVINVSRHVLQEPFERPPDVMTALIDPAGSTRGALAGVSGLAYFLKDKQFIKFCHERGIQRLACDASDLHVNPSEDFLLREWSQRNTVFQLTIHGCSL